MTSATLTLGRAYTGDWKRLLPLLATCAAFAVLFWSPMMTLGRDWWSDPDAGHGLLLAPLAVYLAWKSGIREGAKAQPAAGLAILVAAVLLRYVSGLAAELFTMRASMLGAVFGLVVFHLGFRQLLHWWLPASLLVLSVPLPAVVLGSIANPLQFRASQMGAGLLEWRHVPVQLSGNVIRLPGRALFVTEACSGLRSLASLISLGLLIGGLWLRHPVNRVLLIAAAIPVAMFLNGVRVFLTGFLVFYVDPKLGEGFMHVTEGWIIFVVAFAILGGIAALLNHAEIFIGRRRA
ncbi:MAG TPA: exosortase/archaeosortase family protein [Longimicrobiaceae bacterium]|nr:exosortase/archaeosortase family protein [Longimicrobiaceae bacterium]